LTSLNIEDRDGIRWITLNRPEKLNALTRDDLQALIGGLEPLPADVEAIVLRGTGTRAFSAGVDVDTFRELTPEGARRFITELGDVTAAVRRAPVATICVIQGYCLGGAMELAMACDLRVATTGASFGMPEIKVGIPSVLEASLLQQYVGLSKAREMLLTGDLYPASELAPFGFLNDVVEPADLLASVRRLADRVGRHARPATAAQKRLFQTWQTVGLQAGIEASIGEFAEVFAHPETLERVTGYRAAHTR
jgi:enoyl-CoA hydratase/carnithine racemase